MADPNATPDDALPTSSTGTEASTQKLTAKPIITHRPALGETPANESTPQWNVPAPKPTGPTDSTERETPELYELASDPPDHGPGVFAESVTAAAPTGPGPADPASSPPASAPPLPSTQANEKPTTPPRVDGLDALRGLAILMMALHGIVPGGLPNWMYHGYVRRFTPDGEGGWAPVDRVAFDNSFAAFTWVDWVFPMFLFAMGAAIPLALGRRLDQGANPFGLALGVIWRFMLLAFFAVAWKYIDPGFLAGRGATGPVVYTTAFLGFAAMFPLTCRLPKLGLARRLAVRSLGLSALMAAIWTGSSITETPFDWGRDWKFDIIILLLAWASLWAGLSWLVLSQGDRLLQKVWPKARAIRTLVLLPVLAGVVALPLAAHHISLKGDLSSKEHFDLNTRLIGEPIDQAIATIEPALNRPDEWINVAEWAQLDTPLLDFSPMYHFAWFKFTLVVLMGIVAGQLLRGYQRQVMENPEPIKRTSALNALLVSGSTLIGLVVPIAALWVYLFHRGDWFVLGEVQVSRSTLYALPLAGALLLAGLMSLRSKHPQDRLHTRLMLYSTLLMLLGLAIEPYAHGIKKGPPSTMGYYLIASALSVCTLASLSTLFRVKPLAWLLDPLRTTGQNPMLAYVGIRSVMVPLVALPLLSPLVDVGWTEHATFNALLGSWFETPWTAMIAASIKVAALTVIVVGLTKLRLVWRA